MKRTTLILMMFALGVAVVGVSACSPKPAVTDTSAEASGTAPGSVQHLVPDKTKEPIAGLEDMPDEQKLAELNEKFPVEYPVVAGKVVAAEAVTGNELRYQLSVPSISANVEQWYRSALEGRAFVLAAEQRRPDGGLDVWYERGGRAYAVRIVPSGDEATTVYGVITYKNSDQH